MTSSRRKKIKLAALIGHGSRLPAIYKCCKDNPLVDLALVISDKKRAWGINFAKKKGIEAFYFRLGDWLKSGKTREEFNQELAKILKERKINFIIMAGWYVVMSNSFLRNFPKQVINLHPSLSPAFPGPGDKVLKKTLAYGVKYTGTTFEFVEEGVDIGPVILQRIVKVEPRETMATLRKKIGKEEDKVICKVINWFAQGKIKLKGRKVIISK